MSVRHALLALLSEGPKYGLQLREEFETRTGDVWPLNGGQVYTTLQRLERAGLLDSEWRQTANSRRAKFYTLTRAGMKRLEVETADWTRRASAIARLLRTEG